MKKRFFALVLAAVTVCGMAGCGGDTEQAQTNTDVDTKPSCRHRCLKKVRKLR